MNSDFYFNNECSATAGVHLQDPPGSFNVLLLVWVTGLHPVRVDGDGDEASLLGAVLVVVEVPGLCVGLDQVVTSYVLLAHDSYHAW